MIFAKVDFAFAIYIEITKPVERTSDFVNAAHSHGEKGVRMPKRTSWDVYIKTSFSELKLCMEYTEKNVYLDVLFRNAGVTSRHNFSTQNVGVFCKVISLLTVWPVFSVLRMYLITLWCKFLYCIALYVWKIHFEFEFKCLMMGRKSRNISLICRNTRRLCFNSMITQWLFWPTFYQMSGYIAYSVCTGIVLNMVIHLGFEYITSNHPLLGISNIERRSSTNYTQHNLIVARTQPYLLFLQYLKLLKEWPMECFDVCLYKHPTSNS